MNNFNIQNAYLFGCLEVKLKGRSSKPQNVSSRRGYTVNYKIKLAGKDTIQICKVAFLNIHGLQKNRGRVENIVNSIKKGLSTPKLDGRRTHKHHKLKYNDQQINFVKSFINKLPKYESHYSRNDNHNTVFMTMEYTVQKCYEVYKQECVDQKVNYVSSDKFRRIFTEEFNIKFKNPKTDTCSICDNIQVSLQSSRTNKDEETEKSLKFQQELHHRQAKAGQDAIKQATKEALENKDTYAITF